MATSDLIFLPPLLYVICALSAMSFIVAAARWMWVQPEERFERYVWRGQIQGLVWAMILSIVHAQSFDILGELVVLIIALVFGYRYIMETLVLGVLCLIGWGITIGAGYAVFVFSAMVDLAVFVAGGLWFVPVFALYRMRRPNEKIHKYLWPVLLAYLVLLVPLLVQKTVNSEGWQERQYIRPLKRA